MELCPLVQNGELEPLSVDRSINLMKKSDSRFPSSSHISQDTFAVFCFALEIQD